MSSRIPWSSVMTSKDSYTCVPSEGFMQKQSMKAPKKNSDKSKFNGCQKNKETTAERDGHLDPEQEIAAAASSGDIDAWDPMKFDYQSPLFNSYVSGPGALLPNISPIGTGRSKKPISLFVDNIPYTCTKEWLRGLFSKAGEVKRVHFEPIKRGRTTTYGFVEFATVREMENAIQMFDKLDVGGEKKLAVKVSEDRERREERKAWLRKEEEFLNSLHATGDLDDSENIPDNPLEPRYIPHHPLSPEKPTLPASELTGPKQDVLGSSAGAASLRASPPNIKGEGQVNDSSPIGTQKAGAAKSSGGSVEEKKPCHVCQKATMQKCSECKLPYCSRVCQKSDWAIHSKVCSSRKNNGFEASSKTSPTSKYAATVPTFPGPLKIAEDLNGDGFYVSVGGQDDELAAIEQQVSLSPVGERPSKLSLDLVQTSAGSEHGDSSKSETVVVSSPPRADLESQTDSSLPASLSSGEFLPSTPPLGTLSPNTSSQGSQSPRTTPQRIPSPRTPPMHPDLEVSSLQSPAQSKSGITYDLAAADSGDVIAKSPRRGQTYLSTTEILSIFEQCPAPLSTSPIGEFPPREFVGIVTNVFSSTQFHAIIASTKVKEALIELLTYGSSVTPAFCQRADLNEGSLYGYIDENGDFYRVELSFRSGIVEFCDIGARLTVQTAHLFHIPDKIKSIPRICFQLALRNLYYDPEKKKEGAQFLFSLVNGSPVSVTNFSINAFKNNNGINYILSSLTSLDGTCVHDQVIKSGFAKPVHHVNKVSEGGNSMSCFKKPDSMSDTRDNSPREKSLLKSANGRDGGKDGTTTSCPSQQMKSCLSPTKRGPLLSTTGTRKGLCIDGSPDSSPDKVGTIQDRLNLHQNAFEHRPVTPPTSKSPVESKSGAKYKLMQMSKKVPFHNPPVGVMIEIRPVIVLNPHIIWAQVNHENVANFKLMETDLNKLYGSKKHEPYVPVPGEICAAKYAQDQKYYRVEVLCVNHSGTVDIRFVDYGNRETVTLGQIHHLEPVFLSLPKQALHFSLLGVIPAGTTTIWSDNAVAYLKEKILNRVVHVKIVMQTPATCMAEVWDPDSPMQLVNTSLIELGLAQVQEMGGLVGIGDRGAPQLRGVSITARQESLSRELDKEKQLPPVVSESSSGQRDSSVSLGEQASTSSEDLSVAAALLKMKPPVLLKPGDFEKLDAPSAMNTHPSLLSSSSMKVGLSSKLASVHQEVALPLLAAESFKLSSDSSAVSEQSSSSSNSVITPTFGKQLGASNKRMSGSNTTDTTSLSSSVAMTNTSGWSPKSTTPQSTCSSVTKVSGWSPKSTTPKSTSVTKDSGWSPKSTTPKNTSVTKDSGWSPKSTTPKSTSVTKDSGWSPKLCTSINTSASHDNRTKSNPTKSKAITSPNGGEWSPTKRNGHHMNQADDEGRDGRGRGFPQIQAGWQSQEGNQNTRIDAVQLDPQEDPVQAMVLHVEHPLKFWIQVVSNSADLDSYLAMTNKLSSVRLIPNVKPCRGDFCLCCYPDDGAVYRVKVMNVQGNSVVVQRVDHGNCKKVAIDAIFKMHPEVVSVPAQAIECTLNQLLNPDGKGKPWKQEAIDFFCDEVGYGRCSDVVTVKCVSVINNSLHVVNVKTPTEKGAKDLLNLMVKAKLGGSGFIKVDKNSNKGGRREGLSRKHSDQRWSPKTQAADFIGAPIKKLPSSVSPSAGTNSSPQKAVSAVTQPASPFKQQPASLKKSPFSEVRNKPPLQLKDCRNDASSSCKSSLLNSKPLQTCIQVSTLKPFSFPTNCKTFYPFITEVCNPDKFYIQTVDSSGVIEKLCTLLNNYFSTNKSKPLTQPPSVGSLVCAKFSLDGAWYRGEVIETSADSCNVRFVDYGNAEIVQLCDIAECSSEFISFPILSACCCLHGVAPPSDGTWPDSATQLLIELSSGIHLQAELVDFDTSLSSLKLTNTLGGRHVDIAAELIEKGLAAASTCLRPESKGTTRMEVVSQGAIVASPLVLSLQKVSLPDSHKAFSVLVTEVHSPSEFYIQMEDSCEPLNELFSSLNSYFSINKCKPLTQPPGVGSLVCAKFSLDGAWYRGEVIETSADSCRVRFIDYGNTETVQLSDMAECPRDFISYPILATCCCLHGVAPPSGGTWSGRVTQLLREFSSNVLLQAELVNPVKSPLAIKLTSPSSGTQVDIATELVKKGLAAASKLPKEETVERIEVKPVERDATVVTHPNVKCLRQTPLSLDKRSFTLLITEVYSPDKFYVQTEHHSGDIDELFASLNNYFSTNKSKPLTQPPSVGSLVCAKFSLDGAWYRGEVIETSADSCNVRFIDYGNTEIVQLCDMAECPSEFISVPILSACCCLHGVAPPSGGTWSNSATQLFKELSSGIPLLADLVNSDKSLPALKLSNASSDSNVDLGAELIKEGLAAASTSAQAHNIQHMDASPATTVDHKLVSTYPRVESLQKISFPSNNKSFCVLITEVNSPDKFYVQTEHHSEDVDKLFTSLNNYFSTNKSKPLTQPPSVGSLVCAKFSLDGAWYRGEVIETSADSCNVRFIDYGNTEIVQLCDMAECPYEFISVPILSACCCLHGVAPPSGGTWSNSATQLFKELSSGIPLLVDLVNSDKSLPALKLSNASSDSNVDLGAELIKEGLAAASTSAQAHNIQHMDASPAKTVDHKLVCTYPRVESLQKISFPSDNKSFCVLITEVNSPDKFYVQTEHHSEDVDKLFSSLNSYFSTNKSKPLTQPPSIGSLICAKFSLDGAWYRGEVIETSADSCNVRFIDYGNTEIVQLCDMAECPYEFISFPILSACCCLHGVVPPSGGTWSNSATQLFKELSSGIPLLADLVNSDKSLPALKLSNASSDSNVDLGAELIKEGLAAASTSAQAYNIQHMDAPPAKTVDHKLVSTYPRVESLQKISFPSNNKSFCVLITEVNSPDKFYVQTEHHSEDVDKLFTSLNNYFSTNKSKPLTQPPSVGSLVCAKFSLDGAWYRGEVMKTSADSCNVRFIDYGNTEIVQLCDMAECPSEFISVPILSACCCLHGVAPPSGGTWPDSATQLLQELSSGIPLQAELVDLDTCLSALKLTYTSGSSNIDITTELIEKGLAAASKSAQQYSEQIEVSGAQAVTQTAVSPYPMVKSLQKVYLPADKRCFCLLVTEVYNPDEIYVQTELHSEDVDKLFSSLNNYFSTNESKPLTQPPSVGSLVCAKFSLDGAWYRGEVIETSADSCRVRLVDYGNTEIVQLCDMARCPPEFDSLPILSCQCRLYGVTPPSGHVMWSDNVIQLLKDRTANRVLEGIAADGSTYPPFVQLKDSAGTDIASQLIASGKAAAKANVSPRPINQTFNQHPQHAKASCSSESVSQGLASSSEPVKQGLTSSSETVKQGLVSSSEPVKQELTSSSEPVKQGPASSSEPVKQGPASSSEPVKQELASSSEPVGQGLAGLSSLHCSNPPSVDISAAVVPTVVSIEVHICGITDPCSFYVQHRDKSSISAFRDLMMKIQSTYGASASTYRGFVAKVGTICCSQSTDDSWYRYRVVDLSGKVAVVQRVDFGVMEVLPVDKLLHLDPQFSVLPAQAVPCRLSGVKPTSAFGWNEISKSIFKSLVPDKMRAVVKPHPVKGVYAIDLFSVEGNESVAAALIKGGYAAEDVAACVGPSSVDASKSKSQPQSAPPSVPPIPLSYSPIPIAKEFQVMLTHVESLSEFYVHIVTQERLNKLCELFQLVHDYAEGAASFQSLPAVGSLCVAMFTDGSWYRAQVIEIVDEETCSVFFFDFGNKENVSLFKMKPIAEEKLLTYPIQAFKCGLYGVSVIDSSKWLEVKNLFSTLVPLESLKNCHLLSKYPLLVDFECGSGLPTLSVREELARAGYIPKPSDLGMTSLPMNELPTDGNSVVMLTEINDPCDFWLQVVEESAAKQFEKLMMGIQHYASVGRASQAFVPVLGQLCIANFSQDNIWYRAKIVHVAGEGKVRVQFVDYGNEEVIDAAHLLPFKHNFMDMPSQAIHCSLVGFKVPSPKLKNKFVELVENKKLVAVSKGEQGEMCTSVVLIDTSEDDIFIHEELM